MCAADYWTVRLGDRRHLSSAWVPSGNFTPPLALSMTLATASFDFAGEVSMPSAPPIMPLAAMLNVPGVCNVADHGSCAAPGHERCGCSDAGDGSGGQRGAGGRTICAYRVEEASHGAPVGDAALQVGGVIQNRADRCDCAAKKARARTDTGHCVARRATAGEKIALHGSGRVAGAAAGRKTFSQRGAA